MGLKCGGTPRQRAERLWQVRGKDPAAVDPKLYAKGMVVTVNKSEADLAKQEQVGVSYAMRRVAAADLHTGRVCCSCMYSLHKAVL